MCMKNISRIFVIIFCFLGLAGFSKTFSLLKNETNVDNPSEDGFENVKSEDETSSFLLDFKASYSSDFTLLEWRTEKDSFVQLYVIEVSKDGEMYEAIAEVKPNPSSPNYNYLDSDNLVEDSFYRLKMVDVEGNFLYSSTVMVKVNPLNQLRLFPVPVKTTLNIKGFFGASDKVEVTISDLQGHNYPVFNFLKQTENHYTIDFSSYNTNTYIVNVSSNGKSASYRVQKR